MFTFGCSLCKLGSSNVRRVSAFRIYFTLTDFTNRNPSHLCMLQGVVELADGTLLLSFSGYDAGGGQPGDPMHESLGFATLRFSRQP